MILTRLRAMVIAGIGLVLSALNCDLPTSGSATCLLRMVHALVVTGALMVPGSISAADAIPDLTQSTAVDRERTYNLGSTGMRGWIYTKPTTYLDSIQGRTRTAVRWLLYL